MNKSTNQEVDLSILNTVGRGLKLTPEVVDQLNKAFEMKASNISIANAFNVGKSTVGRYKKKYNQSLSNLSELPQEKTECSKPQELNRYQEMQNRIKKVLKIT